MVTRYIYKLEKNSTLSEIARKLNISSIDLAAFHNNNCDYNDRILQNKIKSSLTFLFVPAETKECEGVVSALATKVALGDDSQFQRNSNLYEENNYNVFIEIDDPQQQHTLKYVNSVVLREKTKNGYVYEINRIGTTYINDEEVNELVDELAVKIASVLYPLQIQTNNNGAFECVHNKNEIANRWSTLKENIKEEYDGEVFINYLNQCEESLTEDRLLNAAIRNDYFIKAVFGSNLYTKYNTSFQIDDCIFSFPLFPKASPVQYRGVQELSKYTDEDGLILVEQRGSIYDTRSWNDLEAGFPFSSAILNTTTLNGAFSTKAFLLPNTHEIMHLYQKCSFSESKELSIMITINRITNAATS